MLINVENISLDSKLYFHTPTAQAKELYLYPLCVGSYRYLPGYTLERKDYPGYSIMLVLSGQCHITCEEAQADAGSGQVALVSGYKPHAYYTEKGLSACWIHFDGVMAERFYNAIREKKGNVITLAETSNCEKLIKTIYDIYENSRRINEATISKYLTEILTSLLSEEVFESEPAKKIYESIRYMNTHFDQPLTVEMLSSAACLSPYYYIRLFKRVTGNSPHDYLLNLRITHAKYYLKTTEKPIKEIVYLCGFTTESSFCNTFRKRVGSSPTGYRGVSY